MYKEAQPSTGRAPYCWALAVQLPAIARKWLVSHETLQARAACCADLSSAALAGGWIKRPSCGKLQRT
jgi:hypothetical protein